MIEAALPVRKGGRDSVDHHANPSQPKLRSGPEPTDCHPLPYRRVEPVLYLHARETLQSFL